MIFTGLKRETPEPESRFKYGDTRKHCDYISKDFYFVIFSFSFKFKMQSKVVLNFVCFQKHNGPLKTDAWARFEL